MRIKGNQLKAYLDANGISTSDAAARMAVSIPTIYKWTQAAENSETVSAKIVTVFPDVFKAKSNRVVFSGNELNAYLRRKQLSYAAASEMLGVARGTLMTWCKQPALNAKAVNIIVSNFADFSNYIDEKRRRETESIPSRGVGKPVPLVSLSSFGGSGLDPMQGVETIVSPFANADIAFRIAGDAMSPDFKNGSIAFAVQMELGDIIVNGNCYVLDTKAGAFLRVVSCTEDGKALVCISANPDKVAFANFSVPRTDVFALYRVVGELTMY